MNRMWLVHSQGCASPSRTVTNISQVKGHLTVVGDTKLSANDVDNCSRSSREKRALACQAGGRHTPRPSITRLDTVACGPFSELAAQRTVLVTAMLLFLSTPTGKVSKIHPPNLRTCDLKQRRRVVAKMSSVTRTASTCHALQPA